MEREKPLKKPRSIGLGFLLCDKSLIYMGSNNYQFDITAIMLNGSEFTELIPLWNCQLNFNNLEEFYLLNIYTIKQ